MLTKEDVIKNISDVMHPAINFSLVKLGIVSDVKVENNTATVMFALPFPNIPILYDLIFSISQPVMDMGLEFKYETRIMSEQEKNDFLKLEAEGWKG
ncbi:MAG: iron-sulfur cluster assembly protein [Bacteroidales bacterium]|nr:iron-sulfur cluster assembly protein [Bacteroidales bacterium]